MRKATPWLATLLATTLLLSGCGGGDDKNDDGGVDYRPGEPVDLARLAASLQLLRATIGLTVGISPSREQRTWTDGRAVNCGVSGSMTSSGAGTPSPSVQLTNCQLALAPGVNFSGSVPMSGGVGLALYATGPLLGSNETFRIVDGGDFTVSSDATRRSIRCACGNYAVRFGSGAIYSVQTGLVDGTLSQSGNDVVYTGNWTTSFLYKGRSHIVTLERPLTWNASTGITAGALSATYRDTDGTVTTYSITFSAGGRVVMSGQGSARSSSFPWTDTAFQKAMTDVLGS